MDSIADTKEILAHQETFFKRDVCADKPTRPSSGPCTFCVDESGKDQRDALDDG
jgi:hypothetical protein